MPRSSIECLWNQKSEGRRFVQFLNIYGQGYSIFSTDLSILPGNVGANTYGTALMIGEKAAVLIAEDLGLQLP